MQAYERSMQKGDTNLVLRPNSDFFRYFGDPSGKQPAQAGAASAPASAAAPETSGQQRSSSATK
jgi:modulator of FtsH protease HflC